MFGLGSIIMTLAVLLASQKLLVNVTAEMQFRQVYVARSKPIYEQNIITSWVENM
jgi:hypothetical protein